MEALDIKYYLITGSALRGYRNSTDSFFAKTTPKLI